MSPTTDTTAFRRIDDSRGRRLHAARTPFLRERRSGCRGSCFVTRHDEEWLDDILSAITAIDEYLAIDGLQ
jgi:hypothetical protein